jgi:hypothetical protein
LHPIKAVKNLFGLKTEAVDEVYTQNNIQKDYGADKKTFANHVLEYLSNRLKWDKVFGKKENRKKYEKPVKQKNVAAAAVAEKLNGDTQVGLFKDKKPAESEVINRSLMKKVWQIYNPAQAKKAVIEDKNVDGNGKGSHNRGIEGVDHGKGKNNSGVGSEKLSSGTQAVRAGGSESSSDLNVPSPGAADNQGELGGTSNEPGGSPGRDIHRRSGRSAIMREYGQTGA